MYKEKRNSKRKETQKKDLLSMVNRIIDDSNNRMEILDFEENTVYEEIKENNLKKTSKIAKQINRKLNSSEILDFDKTTAFEPIKLKKEKRPNTSSKKTSNIKKTSKIKKQINKKLNSSEILDFDKTTAFEPVKLKKVKSPSISSKKTNNIKKTSKITKKINKKLNSSEVLDFNKTTVFEPIKIKKSNKNKSLFHFNLKKFATVCIILTLLFTGFQQITTDTNIITQQSRKVLASLGIYTEEITNSAIESSNYGEPSSWKVERQVKWIDRNKAELTINLDSVINSNNDIKNIILILDTSRSMLGEKLDTLKDVLKEYINDTIDNQDVQISIVTFNNTSEVKAYLTNDKELLINKIEEINPGYDTNYSAAIRSINEILDKNHTKGENSVAVLLTDGYPNMETGSHEGEYHLIKDLFPRLQINAIQYEVGNEIIDELKKVTDTQKSASKKNIKRILLESTVAPEAYNNFIITDYIDNEHFSIESLSDIKTSIGTAMILEEKNNQKIEWNLSNNYITGEKETLKATITLKDEYVDKEDLYLINEKTEIITKRENENQKTKEYKNPLVIKNVYEVVYKTNKPDGCSISNITSDKYFVYTNVSKLSNELNCPGYLFKGWELIEEDEKDIQKINSDVFLMPSHDITLKGTWTKQSITMSMDGKINEKTSLYKVLESEAQEGVYAKEYIGEHQDSMDASKSTEKIYHYYASNNQDGEEILNKNNVIFADYCWQIIRTTDTGGIKLIYNGHAENNQCLNTRGTYAGYQSTSTQYLASDYWYGSGYEFDSINKTFQLKGSLETSIWSDSTSTNLIGKYTCKRTHPDSTCENLYYIESVNSSTSANTLVLTNNSHYSQFGETKFNKDGNTLENVGYMYNVNYENGLIVDSNYEYSTSYLNSSNWFADDAIWSDEENKYILINPFKATATDYVNLVGKYAFKNDDESGKATNIQYIVGIDESRYYYITLSDGNDINYYDYTYTYGDSYTENPDGTYTINNPSTIKRTEWFENHEKVNKKYVCKNAINNSCDEILYVSMKSNDTLYYVSSKNVYKYSNKFIYDGTKYILDEDSSVYIWDVHAVENRNKINNAHYTCLNASGECTSISYINYYSINPKYVVLKNGENIESALNNMLYTADINKNNSIMKSAIEAWYKNYLINYSDYIEDTVYCNDRTIVDKGGWNPNGGKIENPLKFKNSTITNALKCTNERDMFSVNNPSSKIEYKIGLITASEMNLLDNSRTKKTSNYYFTMTPANMSLSSEINVITSSGNVTGWNASYSNGVRPAISLRPGIEYLEGDGSMDSPYIIDTDN